ncbi:unnamed protein product [Arctogadus glacialis]
MLSLCTKVQKFNETTSCLKPNLFSNQIVPLYLLETSGTPDSTHVIIIILMTLSMFRVFFEMKRSDATHLRRSEQK